MKLPGILYGWLSITYLAAEKDAVEEAAEGSCEVELKEFCAVEHMGLLLRKPVC
jgi:hypothetical protein